MSKLALPMIIAAVVLVIVLPVIQHKTGTVTVNGHTTSTWMIGGSPWQGILGVGLALGAILVMKKSH